MTTAPVLPPNLSGALTQAVAVFPAGGTFANLTTNVYTQVKNAFAVLLGLTVNTAGDTSTLNLFDGNSATITVTIASPGVVTWTAHGKSAGDAVRFQTTGALPTGITAGTTYYVSVTSLASNSFTLSDTRAHALAGTDPVNTSGSQSGVHTCYDVTRPIGAFTTVAQGSLQFPALQCPNGLIAVTAGVGPANLTVSYL